MRFSLCAIGVPLLCSVVATAAIAQSITPQHELRAYVGMKGTIPLPDAGAFGEQLNPVTGELALVQTDAWLNTNGLPLSVTRSFTPGSFPAGMPHTGAFGDWQLDVPRITTLTVRNQDGNGWLVTGANPYARCSAFGVPATPTIESWSGIDPNVWWQGYQLIVAGHGEQEILRRNAQLNNLAAEGSPQKYPLVTNQHWQISCLPKTDNESGEAFVAVAPDGSKYTFDHLVYLRAPALTVENVGTINRERALMLATRIEDRFGNVQQFVYDGERLVTIINPNEMQLDLRYRTDVPSLVDQVVLRPYTSNPRIWTYQYANLGTGHETLIGVVRPDGRAWSYNLQALAGATLHYSGSTTCSSVAAIGAAQAFSGSMSDPNGLTGQLTLAGVRHGRRLLAGGECGAFSNLPWKPSRYDTLSLTERRYTGATIGTATWSYRYADASASPSWMEMVDPGKHVTRLTSSNLVDETEGHLSRIDIDLGLSSVLRTTVFEYAGASGAAYPRSLGFAASARFNNLAAASLTPLARQTVTQEGIHTIEWEAFNAFGQATQVRRSNSMASQSPLETSIDYLNDLPHWVLGLPRSVTNLADNTVITQNVYDLAQVTLKESYRFGLRQASYGYDAQGHIATVADGNGLATQYQNYVMGKPATIIYPDGTREENWSDDFGNIVSHIDRAGATTTADYDIMGRITRTHRPSSDGVAWNDTTYNYSFQTQGEWGVPPGHWRVQEDHGEASRFTFYDALMRPVWRSERSNATDDNAWSTQRQDYDWRGRPLFTSYPLRGMQGMDALSGGIHVDYDALDRPVASRQDSEQGALTTTIAYQYDARTRVTDPKGGVTTTSYQIIGEPGIRTAVKIEAPQGVSQTITRNIYGLPLSLTQSGSYQNANVSLTRQYIYDANMRLCRTVEPETGSTVFDYDAGSRVTWSAQGLSIDGNGCGREQVADAAKTTRSYDDMNRVLGVAYPAGTLSSQFTYDAMGRVTSADTGLSRWTYSYSSLGLPTSETLTVDGLSYTLSYAYDANGGLASTTYPDGRVVDHAPDAWGRATQAGNYANSARYLPNGELEYFKYGNGIEYFAEQNARTLPRNLSYMLPNGQLLFSQDFNYDPNGNLTQANDLLQGTGSQRNFQYDALDRLTRATVPGATNSETYSYDPLNNLRRIVNDTGLVRDYQYDPFNRLSQAVGSDGQPHQFAYDNRGNVIQRDSTPFTFDFANRLTEVSGRESYVYDAFGRRVLKTRLGVGGNKTYYLYSNQTGQLMLQRDNDASSTETDYIYLGSKLVAQTVTRRQELPGAISFVPASPSNGDYNVAWGISEGATGYELQEQYNGGAWTTLYSGAQTSIDLSGRQGGTYQYQVRACSSTCGGWVVSSPMNVTPAPVAAVHVPGGVQNGPYTVSWEPSAGATGYDVDELDGNSQMPIPRRIASDTTSTSLQRPGDTNGFYSYRVLAKNAYGDRGWSERSATVQVEALPPDPGPTPPASPVFTSPNPPFDYPVAKFPINFIVEWAPVARATRYEITFVEPNVLYTTTNIRQSVSITQAGTYYISVRACNDAGCSDWSRWGPVSVHLVGLPGGPVRVTPSQSAAARADQAGKP